MKNVQKSSPVVPMERRATLVDALDRVIDKGASIEGGALLQIADIDMLYVGLRVVIASGSRIEKLGGKPRSRASRAQHEKEIERLNRTLQEIELSLPNIIAESDQKDSDRGLAKLVLTIVELIRQLLEREAMRRIDLGNLSDVEIERLGLSLKTLEKKIEQMKKIFGISEDLNLDLGPVGKLM